MKFTIKNVADSLAAYLAPVLPGVTFYDNPRQQGTKTPCVFIQQRSGGIKPKIGGRFLRTIRLELEMLLEYNGTDMQQRYEAVAEELDRVMETFPYKDEDGETALIRTYNREGRITLNSMVYRLNLQILEYPEKNYVPMQTMKQNEVVTDGSETR